jgi:hypothetical protein
MEARRLVSGNCLQGGSFPTLDEGAAANVEKCSLAPAPEPAAVADAARARTTAIRTVASMSLFGAAGG